MTRGVFDYKVLVVTLGKVFVGKTSLSIRFVRNTFDEYQLSTVGALHLEKVVPVEDVNVKVEIWDTAGAEQYESITQQYWRNAHGALCVYDISVPESFERCQRWIDQLQASKGPNFPIMLVGNKADLSDDQRKVPREKARRYAAEAGVMFDEAAAKTGENVEKVFTQLVSAIPIPKDQNKTEVTLQQGESKPQKGTNKGCAC